MAARLPNLANLVAQAKTNREADKKFKQALIKSGSKIPPGTYVRVNRGFNSLSEADTTLVKGTIGKVIEVESSGDVLVDFQGYGPELVLGDDMVCCSKLTEEQAQDAAKPEWWSKMNPRKSARKSEVVEEHEEEEDEGDDDEPEVDDQPSEA